MAKPWPYIGPCGVAVGLCRKPGWPAVAVLLAQDEVQGVGDDPAVAAAVGLVAAGHEGQRRQAGDGHVAGVAVGAERAVAVGVRRPG